jgi:hypothetical protein
MHRILTALAFTVHAPALASETGCEQPETTVEASGYKNVDLVRSERIRIEDKRMYRHALSPMFVSVITPVVGVRYDVMLSDRVTAFVGAGPSVIDPGFGAKLGLNIQPVGNGFAGLYVGPRVAVSSTEFMGTAANVSAVLGYRRVFHPGFVIGAGGGAQAMLVEGSVVPLPLLEGQLGWAF